MLRSLLLIFVDRFTTLFVYMHAEYTQLNITHTRTHTHAQINTFKMKYMRGRCGVSERTCNYAATPLPPTTRHD